MSPKSFPASHTTAGPCTGPLGPRELAPPHVSIAFWPQADASSCQDLLVQNEAPCPPTPARERSWLMDGCVQQGQCAGSSTHKDYVHGLQSVGMSLRCVGAACTFGKILQTDGNADQWQIERTRVTCKGNRGGFFIQNYGDSLVPKVPPSTPQMFVQGIDCGSRTHGVVRKGTTPGHAQLCSTLSCHRCGGTVHAVWGWFGCALSALPIKRACSELIRQGISKHLYFGVDWGKGEIRVGLPESNLQVCN